MILGFLAGRFLDLGENWQIEELLFFALSGSFLRLWTRGPATLEMVRSIYSKLNLFLLSEFSTWELVVADFVCRGKTRVGFPLGPAVPDATGPEVFKSRPEELLLGPSPRLLGRIIPLSATSCSVWFRLTCDWSIWDWLITEPRTGAPSSVWSRSSGVVWLVR